MTNKQKQHLLAYLGYYTGNIDGNWGQLSKTACKAFQGDFGGLVVDGICGTETEKALRHAVAYGIAKPNFWESIKYFDRKEFACPCGRCNGYPAEPKEKLVRVAENVREHFGEPVIVSSGVRCREHNTELPGSVPNSRHMSGKAMDFCVSGFPASAVLPYVQSQPEIRYAYAIDSNFVHMDID